MADYTSLLRDIRRLCPDTEVLENEPMSRHCSFRIGGPCAAMISPGSLEDVLTLCRLLRQAGEEPLLIGKGTNLLVTDEPLQRVVLRMGDSFAAAEHTGEYTLQAQSGISLAQLASFAASRSLGGLEFAHGIPGTLGGAVSMNAGAYGGEMKDVVTKVTYLDNQLNLRETANCEFAYRHSRFSDTGDVILSAELRLLPDPEENIRSRMRLLMEKRKASQPLDLPSAGSTFKRPASGYAAAMIDEAGLKGFAVGGAQVSPKHAGFVVNNGGATFADVRRLMVHVQETVYKNTGIQLEPEVKIIEN